MKKFLAMLVISMITIPLSYSMNDSKALANWLQEGNRTELEREWENHLQRPLTQEELKKISDMFNEIRANTQAN
jgi:hypothetical protein